MKPDGVVYEGGVTRVTQRLTPVQQVEFKVRGHDITLIADSRFLFGLHPGDRIYAVCRGDGEDKAIVLDMLRCGPGETIPEGEKADLLRRLGLTTEAPKPARPKDTRAPYAERVFRSCLERVEVEYLKALKRLVIDPVIMVDARDQAGRRAAAEARGEKPGELERVRMTLTVGSRSAIARQLAPMSRDSAEALAKGPEPERPFTVVVITEEGISVFNRPEPG